MGVGSVKYVWHGRYMTMGKMGGGKGGRWERWEVGKMGQWWVKSESGRLGRVNVYAFIAAEGAFCLFPPREPMPQ